MHLYKKTVIAILVGSCLGSVALAQDDDFSINITGPSDSQVAKKVVTRDTNTTQAKARVNATNQQNTQARAATTTPTHKKEVAKVDTKVAPKTEVRKEAVDGAKAQVTPTPHLLANESNTPTQEYDIQKQDTIWSIANKFLPANSPVNEFQAVASIYRHNPDAFARGNVNNLRMTKIKIPSAEMMALESSKTGSDLLKKGSIQLPPLSAANTKTATGGALPDNVLNMFDSQLAKNQHDKKTTDVDITKALNTPANQGAVSPAKATSVKDEPNYVAHETAIKNNMIDADGVNQFARSADKPSSDATTDTTHLVKSIDINKLLNKSNDMNKAVNANNVGTDADSLALQELIKKSQVDTKRQYNVLSKKIDEGILRSEVVAKSAASTVAKDEVIKALTDYEQIINQLQQANIELRATLSRMNKQIDNVRALGLQNQDGLADVHQLLSNYSTGSSMKSDKAPEGPMMWILLGVGLLSLILASTFMVIRMKTKSSNKQTQTAMANMSDDDDGASSIEDEVLLSSTVNKTNDEDISIQDIDEKKK